MSASGSNWKKKLSLSDCFNYCKKVVKDMAQTAKGVIGSNALRQIPNDALEEIIYNTQINIESLQTLYNTLINERVRRGLRLPDERFLDDDTAAQF